MMQFLLRIYDPALNWALEPSQDRARRCSGVILAVRTRDRLRIAARDW